MANNLRSGMNTVIAEERVLGDKATGGLDADQDHLSNVESGLKAAISNPNTSTRAKHAAEAKLETLQDSAAVPVVEADPSEITGRS